MASTTLFFVILGVGAVSVNLMKVVEWLDTPKAGSDMRRARHAA